MTSVKKQEKVIVAMSGGVDSSVAAYLLKKEGFDVAGAYLQVWSDKDYLTNCPWRDEIESAAKAADKIGIPFRSLHIEEEYELKVVDYLIDGYKRGITPNPDIMCNREIKFGIFLEWAFRQGIDYIATGHYSHITWNMPACQLSREHGTKKYKLFKGIDNNKDQSYFLYTLTQEKLAKILFPLGELTKPEVRQIAKAAGLPNWDRKDSQGICFIGKVELKRFLQKYIKPKKGDIITTEDKKIGEHNGVFYYTIGQRHGLDLGSKTESDAYYIAKKRLVDNVIIVAKDRDNPALYSKKLICDNVNWIAGELPTVPLKCKAKIRYRQDDQECQITNPPAPRLRRAGYRLPITNYLLQIKFKKPQFAVAPGQSVVFYQGDECLGGGIIIKS